MFMPAAARAALSLVNAGAPWDGVGLKFSDPTPRKAYHGVAQLRCGKHGCGQPIQHERLRRLQAAPAGEYVRAGCQFKMGLIGQAQIFVRIGEA